MSFPGDALCLLGRRTAVRLYSGRRVIAGRRTAVRLYIALESFMPDLFHDKYRVPSARAPWHDYSAEGAYFLTICTAAREPILANVLQGDVRLTPAGRIVREEWEKSFQIREELSCDAYVLMPNHIHAVVRIRQTQVKAPQQRSVLEREPKSISSFIARFKAAATHRIRSSIPAIQTVWQSRFYDRIIRNKDEYELILNYIRHNPRNSPDYLNPQCLLDLVETHGGASPHK